MRDNSGIKKYVQQLTILGMERVDLEDLSEILRVQVESNADSITHELHSSFGSIVSDLNERIFGSEVAPYLNPHTGQSHNGGQGSIALVRRVNPSEVQKDLRLSRLGEHSLNFRSSTPSWQLTLTNRRIPASVKFVTDLERLMS